MVGAIGGEDLGPSGVQASHADGVLDRFGAPGREQDVPQSVGRHLDDQPGRLAPDVRRVAGTRVQSLSACSLIAATIRGCWWPRLVNTSWEPKSR